MGISGQRYAVAVEPSPAQGFVLVAFDDLSITALQLSSRSSIKGIMP